MGRPKGSTAGSNDEKMRALHAALREGGHCGKPIPIPKWEGLVLATMGSRTRQGCHDVTWAMERLGMIEWVKRESVTPLDQDPLDASPGPDSQWSGTAAVESPAA